MKSLPQQKFFRSINTKILAYESNWLTSKDYTEVFTLLRYLTHFNVF